MTPPQKNSAAVARYQQCEQHAKVEYQLEELAKAVDKHESDLKKCEERQDKSMSEVKKELQRIYNEFLDSKRSPKIVIAVIGAIGVMFSAAGSVIGSIIVAYFKAGGTP
mgnify:CR=1 FL=1